MSLAVTLSEEQLEDLATRIAGKLDPNNKKPFTVAEASRAIGLSEATITLRVRSGAIKKVKDTGRRVLIPRSEVARLQEEEGVLAERAQKGSAR